ncbi:hypothetical protein SOVF_015580 [Spinacia oleracea]|nr:hypothetical protein SOVF_015580 [Spinacia oleracea]
MELMDVGCNTLSKAAMAKGMSNYIFTTYAHAIAFVFLIPLAFLFHRKTPSPPIGVAIILRLFLLGVLCSPTLASAMNNLSPAFTFIMGIIFRMEVLNLRARSSILKSVGTLVSIGGAFIVTLYQGMPITIFPPSPTQFSLHFPLVANETQPNWALGGLFLFASSIFLSLSFVAKTWIARDFNSEILITLISFFFETIVAAVVTFLAENDTSVWTPRMEGISVGTNTLSKAAMAKGMSNYIFTTYTHALALFFLLPLAFFLHRKTRPPVIGWSIILRLFLLGILSCGCSIFLFVGIRYSSPTLASAMNNLSPAFTFIIAIIFRMEMVNLSAQSNIFKLIGTIVSISGAFIVTFYQGLPIILFPSPNKTYLHSLLDIQPNWTVGGLLLATSSIFLSLTYIAKTWIARDFNSEVLITLISCCIFETIVAAMVTLIAENDASVWTPTLDIELISILFGCYWRTNHSVRILHRDELRGKPRKRYIRESMKID